MAEYAADKLELEKVIFIPTGRISYKDEGETSPFDRLHMTQLAIEGNPIFDISDIETRREGLSYTADSLEILNSMYSDTRFFFIVGADSLDYMERWKDPEKIFSLCSVAAVGRYGFDKKRCIEKAEELKLSFGADIHLVDMPLIEISSSQIRERLKDGKSVRYMLPDTVLDYIAEKNLYHGENK